MENIEVSGIDGSTRGVTCVHCGKEVSADSGNRNLLEWCRESHPCPECGGNLGDILEVFKAAGEGGEDRNDKRSG